MTPALFIKTGSRNVGLALRKSKALKAPEIFLGCEKWLSDRTDINLHSRRCAHLEPRVLRGMLFHASGSKHDIAELNLFVMLAHSAWLM